MKGGFVKHAVIGVGCIGLMALTSCTARYQQMLLNKDMQLRDLQARVAELTATNSELEARERGLRGEVGSLEEQARNASATPDPLEPEELRNLKKDLGDIADVRYRNGRISIGIANVVTFAAGSTSLKQSAGRTLRRVARVLNRDYSNHRIYVEGHTDQDPIKKSKKRFRSNRHLSAERADSVIRFLTKQCGIPVSHVVLVGYGATDPMGKGLGKSMKARNRRVEIVVGEEL